MLELIVYGAAGFGQQVMFWVEDANARDRRFEVAGFVDDDPAVHGETRTGYPVLGDGDWLDRRAEERPVAVVLGVAGPMVKRALAERLAGTAIELPPIVHPSAVVSRHATVEPGAVVGPGNVLSVNVRVRRLATVNTACTLGHDAQVESYATLLPGVNVSGGVVIEEGVSVGTGAAIVQGVTIGAGTTVGAGATVVGDLPAGCVAVGTPARPREPRP